MILIMRQSRRDVSTSLRFSTRELLLSRLLCERGNKVFLSALEKRELFYHLFYPVCYVAYYPKEHNDVISTVIINLSPVIGE